MSAHRVRRPWARRISLPIIGALAAILAMVGTAFAYWATTGSGTGTATVGTLNAPTGVQVTSSPGTGTVSVSWTASAASANAPQPSGYYVLRYDASNQPAPACGSTSANLISTSTNCADKLVPVGTYTYVVVAVMKSWTATSGTSVPVSVAKANQAITFTSSAPANATYQGATYTVTATGGGSGNSVTFAIDSAAASVCTINGSVVSFIGVGTCVIDADQAGSTYYNAAPQAQQSFAVSKASQVISYTSSAPSNAVVGGAGYTPTAIGGASGNPVVFTIDSSTATNCSISAGVVTFQHSGSCTVNANQAGNANYTAAGQVQQTFTVAPAPAAKLCFVPSGQTACATSPLVIGAGGTFIGLVRLVDASGNAVQATGQVTVSLSIASGELSTPSPQSVTIATGASDSASFTTKLTNSGNGKSGVVSATAGTLSGSITLKSN